MYCTKCGAPVEEGVTSCPACGAPLDAEPTVETAAPVTEPVYATPVVEEAVEEKPDTTKKVVAILGYLIPILFLIPMVHVQNLKVCHEPR